MGKEKDTGYPETDFTMLSKPDGPGRVWCRFSGAGRGDCQHFVGVPDASDEAAWDEYGIPKEWCDFCWLSYKNAKLISTLREFRDIQGQSGNWDYDTYMHGMFNGLELAFATAVGEEPRFRDAPRDWLHKRWPVLRRLLDGPRRPAVAG